MDPPEPHGSDRRTSTVLQRRGKAIIPISIPTVGQVADPTLHLPKHGSTSLNDGEMQHGNEAGKMNETWWKDVPVQVQPGCHCNSIEGHPLCTVCQDRRREDTNKAHVVHENADGRQQEAQNKDAGESSQENTEESSQENAEEYSGEDDQESQQEDAEVAILHEVRIGLEEIYTPLLMPDKIADPSLIPTPSMTQIFSDTATDLSHGQHFVIYYAVLHFKSEDRLGDLHSFAFGDRLDRDVEKIVALYEEAMELSVTIPKGSLFDAVFVSP